MIKVSVIVAVYNAEKYIKKCLDSLLSQTLEEIEIIAVNDGSTDSSFNIMKDYATKSAKLKYYTKINGGASDARNFGLLQARGEYVGYVDSDDFAKPNMFELMYNKAKENDSDIVECNLHRNFANTEDMEIVSMYFKPGELLCFGRYVVWNKIYKRDFLIRASAHFPVGVIYEDVAFVAKLLPYVKSYGYMNAALVHYVQRCSSVNNSKSEKTMDIFLVLQDIIQFYKDKGFYKQYENELEYLYARILLCSSFVRMCRIPNKVIRKKVLSLNWQELIDTFPKWRKNHILRQEKSKNALFMKMQNSVSYKIFGLVLPFILRLTSRELKG